MEIELLYTETCPTWTFARDVLKAAMAAENIWAPLRLVRVDSLSQAAQLGFSGSPSIRINGRDLWPGLSQVPSLASRIYLTPQGVQGWPTTAMLRQKLRLALADQTPEPAV
jgi:hypothetical protein